jgi:hypothetical protein
MIYVNRSLCGMIGPVLLISGINDLPNMVRSDLLITVFVLDYSLFCSEKRIVNAWHLFQKDILIGKELHNMQGGHVKNMNVVSVP